MSLLIKGMEMPTTPVLFCVHPDGKVFADFEGEWREYKVVPVPQHGRLGDLDALKERATKHLDASNHGSMAEAYFAALIDLIDTAPTIISEEEGE